MATAFPGSAHVRDFGLSSAADELLWAHAAKNGYVIVSKDIDFQQRALLLGAPPKVVWIRLGNCLTVAVAALLRKHMSTLADFEKDPAAAFIALA